MTDLFIHSLEKKGTPSSNNTTEEVTILDKNLLELVQSQESKSREEVTTQAVGEEGTSPKPPEDDGRITTQAIGEEGTSPKPPEDDGRITTQAIGEEGTSPKPPEDDGTITTQAIGEEGTSPK